MRKKLPWKELGLPRKFYRPSLRQVKPLHIGRLRTRLRKRIRLRNEDVDGFTHSPCITYPVIQTTGIVQNNAFFWCCKSIHVMVFLSFFLLGNKHIFQSHIFDESTWFLLFLYFWFHINKNNMFRALTTCINMCWYDKYVYIIMSLMFRCRWVFTWNLVCRCHNLYGFFSLEV